jgi:transposase InsO family protein
MTQAGHVIRVAFFRNPSSAATPLTHKVLPSSLPRITSPSWFSSSTRPLRDTYRKWARIACMPFRPPRRFVILSITSGIRTAQGWLYLAVVLDLYSRKVVGWSMAPTMPAGLVISALSMALQQRRPLWTIATPPQLKVLRRPVESAQYASVEYQALLKQHHVVCSMSRKGNCWDNAVMERFFLNLKMERVWRRRYANYDEARNDINQYIVGFYNPVRLHSTLGYLDRRVRVPENII